MPQPFGVGDVVGGRYKITHHVVTSADQDIIFQATDQVLGREVSIILASWANTKQVATSARELATGNRSSEVEVLDLGLAEDRTYLISSLVDPNQLLDLVVPDSAPYVEPYYTDSLGSELFGRSREMKPQTFDDDAEYYSRLHQSSGIPGMRGKRPSFLDKVPGLNRRNTTPQAPTSSSGLEVPQAAPAPTPASPRRGPTPDSPTPAAARPAPTPAGPWRTPASASASASGQVSTPDHGGPVAEKSPIPVAGTASEFLFRLQIEEVATDLEADNSQESFTAVREARPDAAGALVSAPSADRPSQTLTDVGPEAISGESPAPDYTREAQSSTPAADVPVTSSTASRLAEGEEVVDNPPESADEYYDVALESNVAAATTPSSATDSAAETGTKANEAADSATQAVSHGEPAPSQTPENTQRHQEEEVRYRFADHSSFTSLISVVPDEPATSLNESPATTPVHAQRSPEKPTTPTVPGPPPSGSPLDAENLDQDDDEPDFTKRGDSLRLRTAAIGAAVLALLMLAVVIALFIIL